MTIAEAQQLADITQSLASVFAVIFAGLWTFWQFKRERKRFPQASVSHDVHAFRADEKLYVRVNVRIENIGSILLDVSDVNVRVQLLMPLINRRILEHIFLMRIVYPCSHEDRRPRARPRHAHRASQACRCQRAVRPAPV